MRRALPRLIGSSAWLILVVAGCRDSAPISGTPLSDSEAAALETGASNSGGGGVRREQSVYSPRGADVIASSRKMAADLAALLRAADQPSPPVVLLGEVVNSTSLPSASFNSFKRQLIENLRAAGPDAGLSFIAGKEAGSRGSRPAPQFVLSSDVYDLKSNEGRIFLVDYELRRLEPADPAVAEAPIVWSKRYRVATQP